MAPQRSPLSQGRLQYLNLAPAPVPIRRCDKPKHIKRHLGLGQGCPASGLRPHAKGAAQQRPDGSSAQEQLHSMRKGSREGQQEDDDSLQVSAPPVPAVQQPCWQHVINACAAACPPSQLLRPCFWVWVLLRVA